jgi:hypothetical protein
MYNDDVTRSIAKAAQEVLEGYGKKKMKKEEMDPTDHVKEKDGKFCVYNKDGKVVKEFDKKEDADKYAIKNHDKLMAEVAEPIAKGEKEFKAKHKVKKSGENEDGSVTKEHKEEEEVDEASEKQKKYQAFFQSALKKFGVKSPAELGDKKKEFFDYVDKNYNADNESDVDESLIGSIKKAAAKVKDKVTGADKKKKAAAAKDAEPDNPFKGVGARNKRALDSDPKLKIKFEKEKIAGYVQKIKDAEKKNKNGDMSDDKLDSTEEYYNELINNAEDRIDAIESKM